MLKLITDSATDLPKNIIDEYGIRVIPTPVVIDEKDYFDGETIYPKEFYTILREGGRDIKTYCVNQAMFYENFKPYAERGDELIYFCFSTGIAGTFNAATLAKKQLLEEFPDFKITIIDSKCASIGFGLVVIYALEMQKNGASAEKIIEAARWHADHMEHLFTVETLEYLYKGGRIKRGAFVAGGILDIKPIIEVTDDGKLQAIEKVRGRQKSLKKLVEMVGERGKELDHQLIGAVHGDCVETLHDVEKMLEDAYGCTHFVENFVGCAIGAHTGPGIIGITFLDEVSPYKEFLDKR